VSEQGELVAIDGRHSGPEAGRDVPAGQERGADGHRSSSSPANVA